MHVFHDTGRIVVYAASCLLSRDTDIRITVGAPYVGKDGSPRKAPRRTGPVFPAAPRLDHTQAQRSGFTHGLTGAKQAALRIWSRHSKICWKIRLAGSPAAHCLHDLHRNSLLFALLWQRSYRCIFGSVLRGQISLLHSQKELNCLPSDGHSWTDMPFFLDKSLFVDTI